MGRVNLGEDERIDWEIEALRESIRLDWTELAQKGLSTEKHRNVREHLSMCNEALKDLRNRRRQKAMSSKLGGQKADPKFR
jgi:hypothetical protein